MSQPHFGPKHQRRIGQIKVSPLGLGTVKFGRNTDVKYPSAFDLPEIGVLADLLSLCRDLGINLLDTAPAYGESEARLGRLIRGSRTDWVLSSKVGEFYDGTSHWDFSKEATLASIRTSLSRLGTDYLDIVLVHCPDDDMQVLEDTAVIETLSTLRQQGSIRYIGASTKSVEAGLFALETMDLVMVSYNPENVEQLPVIARAHALEKPVLVKKALSSGHSSDVAADLGRALSVAAAVIVGTINKDHLTSNVTHAINSIDAMMTSDEKDQT